ncbi:MAG TPA: hypothetical protein VNZ52_13440 [Candidatus Thermoplasmatota archaeon]|nr:hypothetical protein [Candidatus Thermoplasmatota archaeon]
MDMTRSGLGAGAPLPAIGRPNGVHRTATAVIIVVLIALLLLLALLLT